MQKDNMKPHKCDERPSSVRLTPINTAEAIIEALEAWLERREKERDEKERALRALVEGGLTMSVEEQHAFVERLMSALGIEAGELPSHEELRRELEGVPPLSELIIAERDEGR